MMHLRTKFVRSLAERLVTEVGREQAIARLRKAGRIDGSPGLQFLRADMLVAIELYQIGMEEPAALADAG